MTIKQFGFLMAASMAAPLSFAQGSSELSLELVTSYSKSTDSIQVDGKSASFKTGGAGLKLRLDTASLGSFYTVAGGGYLPKQSASFAGVELTGPSDSLFYGVRDLSAVVGLGVKRWSLDATADGELSGFTVSTSVAADNTDPHFYIGAEFAISHVPVGIYYRRSQLSADNSVDLNGVDIRILLMEF